MRAERGAGHAKACAVLAGVTLACAAHAARAQSALAETVSTSVVVGALHYALPDQPDFTVGVAALNRGALRVEARVNYEAVDSGSLFVGRRWAGKAGQGAGDEGWSFEITPMIGLAFGSIRALVPALLGSVGWGPVDLYVEAEVVRDLDDAEASYFYAWSELGFKPLDALRIGLVGQRTRLVDSDRSLQRGVFAQWLIGPATLSAYVFSPWTADRYVTVGLAVQF